MEVRDGSEPRSAVDERAENEACLRIVNRLVRKRWLDAFGFVAGAAFVTRVVVTAIPTLPGISGRGDPTNPFGVFLTYWEGREGFRGTLRESLSGIALGLLAIAALPAVASRASRADNVHAHLDSHVGWQLAHLASGLVAVLSVLSLPLAIQEGEVVNDWVSLVGLALAAVILLATGPRYLRIHAGEKGLGKRIARLQNSRQEAAV